jgi:membrane protein YqaA with SNARE-associated domain
MFGYLIGLGLYESLGRWIITSLHYENYFEMVGKMYSENAFLAILAAAITPIPYKVFTIAAGVWKINFFTLVMASIIGRGFRFFLVGGLIFYFGKNIKEYIDRYFEIAVTIFFILLIGGFFIIKYFV